ncbi:hypothetical protein [Vibrio vulnificus]|uniref:hypothetical protein n=1 Tax=Vibrio vulnificus TaxID=672 RepID=UPI00405A3DC4
MALLVAGLSPLAVKLVLALWSSSEKTLEIAVLSQLNHVVVVNITKRSRGIRAAWHFWYAVSFVVKVVCGNLVYAALTP